LSQVGNHIYNPVGKNGWLTLARGIHDEVGRFGSVVRNVNTNYVADFSLGEASIKTLHIALTDDFEGRIDKNLEIVAEVGAVPSEKVRMTVKGADENDLPLVGE
jgi:hypothetical protein